MKKLFSLVLMLGFLSTVYGGTPSPDPLCINCGCQSEYNCCMDSSCAPACLIGATIGDPFHVACCKDRRTICHGTGIRIQLWFIEQCTQGVGNPTSSNTVDYYFLSPEDQAVLSAYLPIIADFELGIELTEAQYAFLDEDHRI